MKTDSTGQAASLVAQMSSRRVAREARWRELSRWICPWRGVFSKTPGDEDPDDALRFTQAASQAVLRGASGMTGGMTPRNASWFKPDFMEDQLREASGARAWLDIVDRRIKDCLSAGGFYQAIQCFNIDLLWSGCALLYARPGQQSPLAFECAQIGTFCVELNPEGRLESVARRISFTARGLADEFGKENVSESVRKKLDKNPWDKVEVWQLVREDGAGQMPVSARYWEEGADRFLREASFHEMPYFFTVWHESLTPYGTGPGDAALPDARQMDKLESLKLMGLAKICDPPVSAPPGYKEWVDLRPGAINYLPEHGSHIAPIIDLGPFAASLPHLRQEIAAVAQRLDQTLYASIFTSIPLDQRPRDMSATEFLERKREALQQLGPVISAYEPNVLTPLLHRVMQTLERRQLLPPPPRDLQGLPLFMKMDFISPMANALRQTTAETTRALFQDVAMMAQAAQSMELLDKIDADQMVDELATGLGAPGSVIRSDEDVAAMRQERARAQREQQQMQNEALQAQTMETRARAARVEADAAQAMDGMRRENF